MSSANPTPDAPPERVRGTALKKIIKKNLAMEPSSGTKGFQTAGSHPSVLPNAPYNAAATGLRLDHQCGPLSSCWE